jgi:hypothetical protein
MTAQNEWQRRYGRRRRQIDRALLTEAEVQIANEERAAHWIENELREQIRFENEKRRRLQGATYRPRTAASLQEL